MSVFILQKYYYLIKKSLYSVISIMNIAVYILLNQSQSRVIVLQQSELWIYLYIHTCEWLKKNENKNKKQKKEKTLHICKC